MADKSVFEHDVYMQATVESEQALPLRPTAGTGSAQTELHGALATANESAPASGKQHRERAWPALLAAHSRSGAALPRAEIARVAKRFRLNAAETVELELEAESEGIVARHDRSDSYRDSTAANHDRNELDPVRLLRRDIGRPPVLSDDEARDLSRRVRLGRGAEAALQRADDLDDAILKRLSVHADDGRAAFDEFVTRNMRLVFKIARAYLNYGLDLEDLIQSGSIGLMRAVELWDSERGYRFSTYAHTWIEQSISRSIMNTGRTIRLPAHVHQEISRIERMRAELWGPLGREPREREIADALDIPLEKVTLYLDISRATSSLDIEMNDEQKMLLVDVLPAQPHFQPERVAMMHATTRELAKVLGSLDRRQRFIVIKRLGLDGSAPMTLEELGIHFGITRERVRQIEAKTYKRLRDPALGVREIVEGLV